MREFRNAIEIPLITAVTKNRKKIQKGKKEIFPSAFRKIFFEFSR